MKPRRRDSKNPVASATGLIGIRANNRRPPVAEVSSVVRSTETSGLRSAEPRRLRLRGRAAGYNKMAVASATAIFGIRRRPTLPDRYQSSTIGTEGLNFCVRYGNRWNPFVITTGNGDLSLRPFRNGWLLRSSLSSSSGALGCFRIPDNCTALDSSDLVVSVSALPIDLILA